MGYQTEPRSDIRYPEHEVADMCQGGIGAKWAPRSSEQIP